jgi:hypothetical protein
MTIMREMSGKTLNKAPTALANGYIDPSRAEWYYFPQIPW